MLLWVVGLQTYKSIWSRVVREKFESNTTRSKVMQNLWFLNTLSKVNKISLVLYTINNNYLAKNIFCIPFVYCSTDCKKGGCFHFDCIFYSTWIWNFVLKNKWCWKFYDHYGKSEYVHCPTSWCNFNMYYVHNEIASWRRTMYILWLLVMTNFSKQLVIWISQVRWLCE